MKSGAEKDDPAPKDQVTFNVESFYVKPASEAEKHEPAEKDQVTFQVELFFSILVILGLIL